LGGSGSIAPGAALFKRVNRKSGMVVCNIGDAAELIDLRSANPLNYEPLAASIRKTGKVLLLCDAVERGCVMQTVAASLTQLCFGDLDAPPVVLGSRNWITPAAELETLFFPQPAWLLDAIHERILPLKGYNISRRPTKRSAKCSGVPDSACRRLAHEKQGPTRSQYRTIPERILGPEDH
jgi:2-oxoisovalerate dehydrogenase E1 component